MSFSRNLLNLFLFLFDLFRLLAINFNLFFISIRPLILIFKGVITIFTLKALTSRRALHPTIITFTILFQTIRLLTITSFFAQTARMQPNYSFLLNRHFRLYYLLLMLQRIFTINAYALLTARYTICKAFTVHFQALGFFAYAFSGRSNIAAVGVLLCLSISTVFIEVVILLVGLVVAVWNVNGTISLILADILIIMILWNIFILEIMGNS